MSDYPKKIHECFKRTLLFGSGKKVRPMALCFVNNFFQDSPCAGTREASDEEMRENNQLYASYPNGSRCASCPFLKSGEYVSDILRELKTFGLFCAQDNSEVGERRKGYFNCLCMDYFFQPLLDRTKSRCYLTFDETDKRNAWNMLHKLDFDGLIRLIDDIENFCKANDIK